MVVFTAIGAGILASGFLGASLTLAFASSAFLLGLATTVVLGAAMRALMPKFSSGANRGYQTTAIGTALDHQVIYGKMRVAGARIYDESTNEEGSEDNKYLHRIIAIAGHEIESYDKIYINDSYVNFSDIDEDGNISSVTDADGTTSDRYDDHVRIKFHYGSPAQEADEFLVDESAHWTSAHTLSGIAYMYIRLKYKAEVFPNGIPEVTAEVKGKKVSDPRTSTVAWSDNPSLCLRDYLTSPYGISEDEDNIDDTLVIAAANVSDQLVGNPVFKMFVGGEYKIKTVGNTDFTLYGAPNNNVGTVFIATGFPTDQDESGIVETARYTCNGAFTTAATPYDMINALLTSMDGSLWYAQGKWRMKPAYWTAPVLDLNEDDLRSSISVSTRHSRRDNFNTVKGTFRGLESNWQTTDYPQVSNAAFVTADNDQESVADVDLPFTDNSVEARRIALISLERNRQQLTVNASFGLKTLQLQVGDNIRLTNSRFGWDNKEFEVVAWNFGLTDGLDLQTQMTLRETAESVFDEVSDGVVYERDNTTLPSPFEAAVPLNLLANSTSSVNDDGTTISQIAFSWSVANVNLVDHYEFEWKLSTDTNYNSFNMLESRFVLSPAISNKLYNYRARSVNPLGVPSIWVYGSTTVSTVDDQTIPSVPTGVSVAGGYKAAKVSWIAPTTNTDASAIKDLFQYAVYRGTSANPTTLIGFVSGTTFSDDGLLNETTYYYRVKAFDFTGNPSGFSSNGSGTTNPALVDGIDGLNNTTVFLYNKSSSATPPTLFSGTFTYTFSTGVLSGGTLNGWSQEPPSLSKGDNLWVSLATASSRVATDNSIPTAEFSTPEITSIAGIDGATTARVSLFRKTSTNSAPADPSGTFTYTFATGVLSGGTLNGWSQSAPSLNNGEYLWVIQASAFSSNPTDTIAASEFNAASITGIGGTNGNPAKLLVLNATDQVFTYDESNVADPTSQTITFTALLENTDDTTATWSSSPSVTLTGTGNSRSLSVANFGSNTSVTVTASADSGAVSDVFTVYRLKDGADGAGALTLILSNEAHTFAADAAGVVASYSGSGTTIKLFEGTTELRYQQGSTANSRWSVATAASNITVGSISDSGNFATVNNHSNMTQDNASIVYTITGKRADGSAISLTKTQSFSKSKVGNTGGTGPTGPSGDIYKTIYLYDAKATIPASIAITAGFNASTGNASSTGTWTTTVPTVSSGQVLWLASLTIKQTEATGNYVGQGSGWVITQAQGYAGDDGSDGSDAPRFASRTLYTNPAVVTPSNTTPTATITWSTGAVSSISSGWSLTPPTQIANASEKVWSSNLLFVDVSPPFSTTGATGSTPIQGTSFSGLVSFVDGDFALDGSTITNIDGGNITTGSIVADKITVDGTLTLAGPTSGFIGGRTTTADFGTDGFYVGRTSTNGTSANGFQLSHTSVTNSSHPQLASGVVQAIIHDDVGGLRAYEPVFYQKGTGVGTNIVRHEGATGNITLTKGEIHTVFLIGGGGGGGGTSLSQQNPNFSSFPAIAPVSGGNGGTTSVSLTGATGYTGTRSFSSVGGLGAPTTLRSKSSWTNGLIGDSSPFGTGGAGGVPFPNNSSLEARPGQDAPTANYGAGGGGASGSLFNDSGTSNDSARVGGWGGRVSSGLTVNIDLTNATTNGTLSVSIGSGGNGGNGTGIGDGGDGTGGAVSVSGIIDGYIPNTLEEIVNGTGSSDRTLKNNIRLLTDAEMRVAEAISFLQFELNSDPDHKRFGVIAQEVIEAFTTEGLNYNDYFVVVGQEGGYQVAYRQVLSLVAAATRQRLSSHTTSIANFEARISALEST